MSSRAGADSGKKIPESAPKEDGSETLVASSVAEPGVFAWSWSRLSNVDVLQP